MNPFYQAMGPQPNMMQRFQQFMGQMQGRNPRAMLNDLVSSGRVSQEQLNAAQQQAQQLAGMFQSMGGTFGRNP